MSVMASYNEIDGVPSHANRWLLRDVLRGEWGFKGYVVSDYYAIRELAERPGAVRPSRGQRRQGSGRAGRASGREHRAARARLLQAPRRAGARRRARRSRSSTNWSRRCWRTNSSWGCSTIRTSIRRSRNGSSAATSNRKLALEAARKTITLLKNDGRLLPLDVEQDQDACRHRPQRRPRAAGRLQRQAEALHRPCSTGIRAACRRQRRSALPRRLQNHDRRLLAAGRSRRRAIRPRTAAASPKR